MTSPDTIDPSLDLVLERETDVAPALVWKAWTVAEHLRQWWAPAPWTTPEAELDLRPGGTFRTLMRGPDGESSGVLGCILEVIPERRLVWTIALDSGFRPVQNATDDGVPQFTAMITFEPNGAGTRYRAVVRHRNESGRDRHRDLGFFEGWGSVTDQLLAHAKSLR